jgi:hypothetical protein
MLAAPRTPELPAPHRRRRLPVDYNQCFESGAPAEGG